MYISNLVENEVNTRGVLQGGCKNTDDILDRILNFQQIYDYTRVFEIHFFCRRNLLLVEKETHIDNKTMILLYYWH